VYGRDSEAITVHTLPGVTEGRKKKTEGKRITRFKHNLKRLETETYRSCKIKDVRLNVLTKRKKAEWRSATLMGADEASQKPPPSGEEVCALTTGDSKRRGALVERQSIKLLVSSAPRKYSASWKEKKFGEAPDRTAIWIRG